MVSIGTNIRVERAKRDWTQGKLSKRTGLRTSTISQVEAGKQSPTLETLQRIAAAFELPITALMDTAPATQPSAQQNTDRLPTIRENQPHSSPSGDPSAACSGNVPPAQER